MWVTGMAFDYEFPFLIVIKRRWKLTRENAFLEIPKGTRGLT
jgi:hypothetical protein